MIRNNGFQIRNNGLLIRNNGLLIRNNRLRIHNNGLRIRNNGFEIYILLVPMGFRTKLIGISLQKFSSDLCYRN